MNTPSTDSRLMDSVKQELDWDPRVNASHIGISAHDGAITLSGETPAYWDKMAAVRAAERVYGVKAVADEIEVKLPNASIRTDSDIADAIVRDMSWNNAIPETVKADVSNGHVTLRGTVHWGYQRDEAARTLRYLEGVHGLTNLIALQPSAAKIQDVETRVSEAITRMANVDARSIWVTATNGTVHLHGHVHSLAERRIADRAAASAPGVTDVKNEILITP